MRQLSVLKSFVIAGTVSAAFLVFAGCRSTDPTATVTLPTATPALATPTTVPTPTTGPSLPTLTVNASVSQDQVLVGETVTITADGGSAGIPQYSLSINDDLHSTIRYDSMLVSTSRVDLFPLVSWTAGPTSASWTLTTTEPGEFEITVFVSGEISISPTGPFLFTSGTTSLHLTVDPA